MVIFFLCQEGFSPFAQNIDGKTPSEVAEAKGHKEIVSFLHQSAENQMKQIAEWRKKEKDKTLAHSILTKC